MRSTPPLPVKPLAAAGLFPVSPVLPLTQQAACSDRLLSRADMLPRFIQSFCGARAHFYLPLHNMHCMDIPQFVDPFTAKGHLGCSRILAIVNKAAVNVLFFFGVCVDIHFRITWVHLLSGVVTPFSGVLVECAGRPTHWFRLLCPGQRPVPALLPISAGWIGISPEEC